MKVNRYKIKDGVTFDDILKLPRIQDGGNYVEPSAKKMLWKELYKNIDVNIAFPEDLSTWDDFNFILVIDDDFGQPYTPFYNHLIDPHRVPFSFVEDVINNYNQFMSELGIFEEV